MQDRAFTISGERRRCAWCGHALQRAHQQRLAGAVVRRHCDRCADCEPQTISPFVRRARAGLLPAKVIR